MKTSKPKGYSLLYWCAISYIVCLIVNILVGKFGGVAWYWDLPLDFSIGVLIGGVSIKIEGIK